MPFSPAALLKSLETSDVGRGWHIELKHGRKAYDFLKDAIERRELTSNQMRNALHALFRIRGHGGSGEVFDVLVGASADTDSLVRSDAIQLALGLEWFSASHEKKPVVMSEAQERQLKEAWERGVEPSVEQLLRKRFGEGGKGDTVKGGKGDTAT